MKVRVIAARELDAALRTRWLELVDSNDGLQSAYFRPEFTEAVAGVRPGARVGVLENAGRVEGFLPFEPTGRATAGPIGGRLSDFQAVVAAPDSDFDAAALVRGCGLAIFDFDHLLAAQQPFRAHHRMLADSPVMDLSSGFEAYCAARRSAGSQRIRQLQRKARKLERELGDLRFEARVDDPKLLARVIEWKSEQCRRTGSVDFFRAAWARRLVERIASEHSSGFSGIVSALYQGDRVIAAHMGMHTQSRVHWWFPVYDHAFEKYSPGAILLLRLAEALAAEGITSIDLGKGDDPYKGSFMTGAIALAEGSVILPSLTGSVRRLQAAATGFLRRSPLTAPARALRRRLSGRARG